MLNIAQFQVGWLSWDTPETRSWSWPSWPDAKARGSTNLHTFWLLLYPEPRSGTGVGSSPHLLQQGDGGDGVWGVAEPISSDKDAVEPARSQSLKVLEAPKMWCLKVHLYEMRQRALKIVEDRGLKAGLLRGYLSQFELEAEYFWTPLQALQQRGIQYLFANCPFGRTPFAINVFTSFVCVCHTVGSVKCMISCSVLIHFIGSDAEQHSL